MPLLYYQITYGIGPLVLTLVSSGIRIDAFETLKWKHITPTFNKDKNEVIATKILVYPGNREQYYSFVTPEVYISLDELIGINNVSIKKL